MRSARVARVYTKDVWEALGLLERLIAHDDPRQLVDINRDRALGAADIHALVRDRIRFVHGREQRWATPRRTYESGFGDCGNSSRLILCWAKLHGIPGRLRVFVRDEKEPGILGKTRAVPGHVVAQLWDGRAWRWAEAAIDARFGEHTLAAARRLGMPTSLREWPVSGRLAGPERLARPIAGDWPWPGQYPAHVVLAGRVFDKSAWAWPYPGVRAQYRERVPRGSMHMHVRSRRWEVTHRDAVNPALGSKIEHLMKDVVRPAFLAGQRPIGIVGTVPQEVPATKTPVSPSDMWVAMGARYGARVGMMPSAAQLTVLMTQWMLETGNGDSMIQWNIGNVKHVSGDGLDWCTYQTTEVVNGQSQSVSASFKAYDSLADGLDAYFDLFLTGRYSNAWPAVVAGDMAAFAAALKAKGYYTASEASYAAGMQARASQLAALDLPDPCLPASSLPALGALFLGIGGAGAAAYAMGFARFLA